MTFQDAFKTVILDLRHNKSRSALTILGIVIGVAAIIMVMSVSQGAKNLILRQIESIGSDVVVIRPGREPRGPTDIAQAMLSNSLKDRDLVALEKKNNVPDLESAAPSVFVAGNVSYQGNTYNRATIIGWVGDWISKVFNIYPKEGILFGQRDVEDKAEVAVIGAKVKENLFGSVSALGKKIKIRNKKFRVVGVLPLKGQVSMFNIDDMIVIPYTTAQQYLLGTNYYNEILVKARNDKVVPQMVSDIKATLRELHHISNPTKDDFTVMTQTDMAERVGTITGILSLLLLSVAAISLVVGGIGVMNVMLVSVAERTREIGLRKAIGATNRDILIQFLLESILLTVIGGIFGIIIGGLLAYLASFALGRVMSLNWVFSFPVVGALVGFGVSAAVGLIFGLYPARKASQKSPMEALRYE